ncbi:DivIVA domain-containing protein [Streptomyces halobius]|uniref:DivIVA domain-containing protein n=1 Tax=Streptomyces halobius TaxID=2879846 RepID=A0ABY4M676_9ACTN|nr:DivIVA domain-containing protein [Streptomyces halobius]UQA93264.1 DivIVA domain-containing protein [Streptomyces halobius]
MFWFLLIAMVVVVSAVTLIVVGGGDAEGGGLRDSPPDRLYDPLPDDRPLGHADVEAVRLPVAVRGYRMSDVDDVLDRLGAELAERDSRIAELEAALAGAHAAAMGAPGLIQDARPGPVEDARPGAPQAQEPSDRPEGEERA